MSDTSASILPIEQAPDAPFNPDAADDTAFAARYLSSVTPATPTEQPEHTDDAPTSDERPRDAQGRFVAQQGDADAETPEAIDDAPADADADTETPNDDADAADDAPKPAGNVVVAKDADGEVEIPLDVTLPIKINGKVREEPLSAVIRMAQSGGYNEQLQAEVKQARELVPTLQQRTAEIERAAQDYMQEQERRFAAILADPAMYEAARQHYAEANSPEQRAARAEQQLRERIEAEQRQQATTWAQQTVEQTVLPKLADLEARYPSVTMREILWEVGAVSDRLKVAGTVPPQRIPELAALIDRDVAATVAALHAERAAKTTEQQRTAHAAQRAAEAKAEQKAREAHAAKRTLTRRLTSTTGRAPGLADTPPPKPIKTAEDAMDAILARARTGYGR